MSKLHAPDAIPGKIMDRLSIGQTWTVELGGGLAWGETEVA